MKRKNIMNPITVLNLKADIVALQLKIDAEGDSSNPLMEMDKRLESMLEELNSDVEISLVRKVIIATELAATEFQLEVMKNNLPLTTTKESLEEIKGSSIDINGLAEKYETIVRFMIKEVSLYEYCKNTGLLQKILSHLKNQIILLEDFNDVSVDLTLERHHKMYENFLEIQKEIDLL